MFTVPIPPPIDTTNRHNLSLLEFNISTNACADQVFLYLFWGGFPAQYGQETHRDRFLAACSNRRLAGMREEYRRHGGYYSVPRAADYWVNRPSTEEFFTPATLKFTKGTKKRKTDPVKMWRYFVFWHDPGRSWCADLVSRQNKKSRHTFF